jgi:hypothetical protein
MRPSFVLLSVLISGSLVGCAAGVAPGDGDGGSPFGQSTVTTEPAPSKDGGKSDGASSSSSSSGGTLGPSCKAYVACCEELAQTQPSVAASCASVTDQIESAIAKGAPVTSYETSCKSGVDGFKQAGYCK